MGDDRKLAFAKAMRRAPSATERLLWKILRDRRLGGLKFRRQVPVGRYIVDFVCMRHRLVVEADGPLHDEAYDTARDDWLRGQNFRVMRFSNRQIEAGPELVLSAILAAVEAPMSSAF